MKKRKCQQYLKLVMLLFGVTLVLSSCQKDDDLKSTQTNQVLKASLFKLYSVNKIDILENRQLNQELDKIIEQSEKSRINILDKTVYSNEYDFYINTDYATYIENDAGTYHSYTFPVLRSYENDTLENLVLSLKDDGTYNSILFKYLTTAQEKQTIEDGLFVDLTDRVLSFIIDDDILINDIFSKAAAPTPGNCLTYDYSTGACQGGFSHEHESVYNGGIGGMCGGSTSFVVGASYDFDCIDGQMSGNGSPGGSSTGTGATGQTNNGGASNNGTVTTSPTPCRGDDCPEELEIDDLINEKNCEELNKISTMPTLQDEFNTLENSLGLSYEKGFALTSTPQAPNVNPQVKDGESGCKPISMPSGIDVFGFMHTHPNGCGNGTHAMFGNGDIYSLYKYSQSFNPNFPYEWDNSLFTIFMTVDDNHYAIKINDIFSNNKNKRRFKSKLERAYSNSSNSTTGSQFQLAKAFLETVTKQPYDLGLSLYKTSHDDINTTGSNWTRLKLDEYGNIDDSQDCN